MSLLWWRSEIVESEQIPSVRALLEAEGWKSHSLVHDRYLTLIFNRPDKPPTRTKE